MQANTPERKAKSGSAGAPDGSSGAKCLDPLSPEESRAYRQLCEHRPPAVHGRAKSPEELEALKAFNASMNEFLVSLPRAKQKFVKKLEKKQKKQANKQKTGKSTADKLVKYVTDIRVHIHITHV